MAEKRKDNPPCPRVFLNGAKCDGELIRVTDDSPRIQARLRCTQCGRNYVIKNS